MKWILPFLRMINPPKPMSEELELRVAQLEVQFKAARDSADLVTRRVDNITKHLGLDEVIENVADEMK